MLVLILGIAADLILRRRGRVRIALSNRARVSYVECPQGVAA
jgi:hypothetical protein